MEMIIKNREVKVIGDSIVGFEGDNCANIITVTVDKPKEWIYKLEIQNMDTGYQNIIAFTRIGNTLIVNLEQDMFPVRGYYNCQFRATNAEEDKVEHTQIFNLFVKDSLSYASTIDKIPYEFRQLEEKMEKLLSDTKAEKVEVKQMYAEIQAAYEDIQNLHLDFDKFAKALEEHNSNPKAHENIEIDCGVIE